MQIYRAPTEGIGSSKLPAEIASISRVSPPLETVTGADLLVSMLDIPATSETLLKRHCSSGALVQIKHYADFSASIPDQRLFHQVQKMTSLCRNSWIVVIGVPFAINGKAVIGEIKRLRLGKNGIAHAEVVGRPALSWASLDGAIDAVQYYGAYIKFLDNESELIEWLKRLQKALVAIENQEVTHLKPRSALKNLAEPGPIGWLSALFEGIGTKLATQVFEQLKAELNRPATLAEAMAYVISGAATDIAGISPNMVASWKEFLGFQRWDNEPAMVQQFLELFDPQYAKPKTFSIDILRLTIGGNYKIIAEHSQTYTGTVLGISIEQYADCLVIKPNTDTEPIFIAIDKIVDMEEQL